MSDSPGAPLTCLAAERAGVQRGAGLGLVLARVVGIGAVVALVVVRISTLVVRGVVALVVGAVVGSVLRGVLARLVGRRRVVGRLGGVVRSGGAGGVRPWFLAPGSSRDVPDSTMAPPCRGRGPGLVSPVSRSGQVRRSRLPGGPTKPEPGPCFDAPASEPGRWYGWFTARRHA